MFSRLFSKRNKHQDFWTWFSKNADSYFNFEQDQNSLFTKLKSELEKINPTLTFEFSPVLANNTREFIISADGIKSVFPVCARPGRTRPRISKLEDHRLMRRFDLTFYRSR